MKRVIAILLLAGCLQGCIGVFVAGAAAGGAVVYDRRSLKTISQDMQLSAAVSKAINSDTEFSGSHIVTSSFHHVVLLAGQTPNENLRTTAEQLGKAQPGVRQLYNEIQIGTPTSALTRSSDSWITTKVKTEMLARKGLNSSSIKVITENGVVFLIGQVTPDQADLAVAVTRKVSGVQKVVTILKA